jgi:hypothetical protein
MLVWAAGILAVVAVGAAFHLIESVAAMRGQKGQPLSGMFAPIKTFAACINNTLRKFHRFVR